MSLLQQTRGTRGTLQRASAQWRLHLFKASGVSRMEAARRGSLIRPRDPTNNCRRFLSQTAYRPAPSPAHISSSTGGTSTSCKKLLHSSALQKQSTTTMDFTHSAPSILNTPLTNAEANPSANALRTLFVASSIPMVGFGFMDNVVMIQAGQYIDSTLGVSLGLATMTAAAAGQVVSDVSGVVFGGSLERFLTRMGLIKCPALSAAQRQLPICRNVSMAGAVVGVIIGCCLGATTLLMVDLEARSRIERVNQLREIVTDMTTQDDNDEEGLGLTTESCTVYVANSKDFELDENSNKKWRTSMKLLKDAESEAVQECASKHEVMLTSNGNFLYVPIMDDGDEVLAVIEFRHNRNNSAGFSDHDARTAKIMGRHIAIFMNRMVE